MIDRLKKPVEIHCHQDFGLGVANTIAALAAGASVAHTTVTGLGERAGNVPMEDVVMSLLCLYGIDLGIHTEKFCEVSRFVMDLARVTQPPNRPIVGDKLYEVESGIIAGWIRMARKDNPLEFVPFAADLVGQKPVSTSSSARTAVRRRSKSGARSWASRPPTKSGWRCSSR